MSAPRAPRRSSRAVDALVVVAGGSWGAVAGGALFAVIATAFGAPTGTGQGEILPGFGWNRFTAFVVGMPFGFAIGALMVLRASRRWPWLVGLPAAILGGIAIATTAADRSGWDSTFSFFVVPILPGIAFVVWWRRRAFSR